MTYFIDRESYSHWYALYEHRIKKWNGVNDQMRWANIGGRLVVPQKSDKPPFWIWNSAMHQLYLSSYHINKNNVKYYIDAIKKYRINYLLGYVSSLHGVAITALEQNLDILELKLIITNAEPLLPYQRHAMETAFKCPVIQTYSSSEFSFGGNEYLDGNLYLWPEAGIVETIDETGNFTSPEYGGELVATGFINMAMPLVRFKTGDFIRIKSGSEMSTNYPLILILLKKLLAVWMILIRTDDGRIVGRLILYSRPI